MQISLHSRPSTDHQLRHSDYLPIRLNYRSFLSFCNDSNPRLSPLSLSLQKRQMITTQATSPSDMQKPNKKVTFWFATGGAGFCLSRSLAEKMLPIAGNGKFVSVGDKIRFPDDVTMGFIIEHMLKIPLTVVDQFHSHLEPMEFLRPETFQDQVSFSYAKMKKDDWNIIKIDGFDEETDPKRFLSLHCHLFPYYSFCLR